MRRWAAALALAALVAPAWVAAPQAGAAPAALCSPSQSGSSSEPSGKSVAIVIDDGRGSVDARCVEVNDSVKDGAQFLAARAEILGTPPPTYDRSNLLCSIDGYPETGCGERTGDTYAYWSYWDGQSGTWVYSSIGPGSRRMTNNSVEGWRFLTAGTGGNTNPPPDFPADRERICPIDPPTEPTDPANPPTVPANPPTVPANPPTVPANPPTVPANPPTVPADPTNPKTEPTNPPTAPKAPLTAPRQQPTTAKRRTPAPTPAPTTASPTAAPRKGAPTAPSSTTASRDGAATQQPAPTTLPGSGKQPGATLPRAPETIAGVSPSSTKGSDTTTSASEMPQGGPTTLADGDEDDPPGRVTNVAQAGDLAVPGSKKSSRGWLGAGVGVGVIGASFVSARWLRRRRLS